MLGAFGAAAFSFAVRSLGLVASRRVRRQVNGSTDPLCDQRLPEKSRFSWAPPDLVCARDPREVGVGIEMGRDRGAVDGTQSPLLANVPRSRCNPLRKDGITADGNPSIFIA